MVLGCCNRKQIRKSNAGIERETTQIAAAVQEERRNACTGSDDGE